MGREQESNNYFTGLQGESKSAPVLKILCTLCVNIWNEFYSITGLCGVSLPEGSQNSTKPIGLHPTEVSGKLSKTQMARPPLSRVSLTRPWDSIFGGIKPFLLRGVWEGSRLGGTMRSLVLGMAVIPPASQFPKVGFCNF